MLKTQSGLIFYWGGFTFQQGRKMHIDGFNLLQEEPELKHLHLLDLGLGYLHDTLLVQEGPTLFKDLDFDLLGQELRQQELLEA